MRLCLYYIPRPNRPTRRQVKRGLLQAFYWNLNFKFKK